MKPYHTCPHTAETLKELQALPLKQKVFETRQRIVEWYEYWEGKVYVAFSGGKDSTVLLDIVRRDFPDVPAVFCDTGLEFPEIRDFVKTIDNVVWLKPKMTFKAVLEKYGYPVVSKKTCNMVRKLRRPQHEGNQNVRRLYLTGINSKGESCQSYKLAKKWHKLIDAPFAVSEQCCDVMKKAPAHEYQKQTGFNPMTGEMAADSKGRRGVYLMQGCNAFGSKFPKSMPMSFWHEDDIWDYIHLCDIAYSPIYNMGYDRTGCVFCAFGAHMEKGFNRFQTMKATHPRLHKYCMENLGMKEVLDYCHIPTEPGPEQLELF